jgi:ribosomal protein S18 acetylase RimI-like enzyme
MELSSLAIRDARIDDAAALAEAEREIAKNPGFLASRPFELTDERFAKKIAELSKADNGKYLVAQAGDEIVGHAMLDPLSLSACRHVVHLTLVVHPGRQGKGNGKFLLGELIKWAKANDVVEKIELHVRSSNAVALSLYEKFGFTEVGRWSRRVKVSSEQYLDDVSMELRIK